MWRDVIDALHPRNVCLHLVGAQSPTRSELYAQAYSFERQSTSFRILVLARADDEVRTPMLIERLKLNGCHRSNLLAATGVAPPLAPPPWPTISILQLFGHVRYRYLMLPLLINQPRPLPSGQPRRTNRLTGCYRGHPCEAKTPAMIE
eukprot:scaffold247915_cov32-Tisochrysis_lutea.AAC.1